MTRILPSSLPMHRPVTLPVGVPHARLVGPVGTNPQPADQSRRTLKRSIALVSRDSGRVMSGGLVAVQGSLWRTSSTPQPRAAPQLLVGAMSVLPVATRYMRKSRPIALHACVMRVCAACKFRVGSRLVRYLLVAAHHSGARIEAGLWGSETSRRSSPTWTRTWLRSRDCLVASCRSLNAVAGVTGDSSGPGDSYWEPGHQDLVVKNMAALRSPPTSG